MDREKQIEEKHELSESIYMSGYGLDWKDSNDIAEQLYNAGYRKIQTTDWLTKGISKEQLEREKNESLKEFFDGNCKKYGYYKKSEVVREIIGEILLNHTPDIDGFFIMHESELAEFKKKYTEESGNDR